MACQSPSADTTPIKTVPQEDPKPPSPLLQTFQLTIQDPPKPIPNTPLKASISESSHKSMAPVAALSVLIDNGTVKAESHWGIEEEKFNTDWQDIGGRRWSDEAGEYVESHIHDWQLKLISIDDTAANAAPDTITLSIRQRPQ